MACPRQQYIGQKTCSNIFTWNSRFLGRTGLGRQHTDRCRHSPNLSPNQHVRTHAVASVESTSVAVDGSELELLKCSGNGDADTPPVLFVHGAAHGAWCWAEHFMPELAAAGIDSYAMSLRGHGGSPRPADVEKGQPAGTMQSHSEDVACVLRTLPSEAVVVGHSFGGLLLQKYLELAQKDQSAFPVIRGAGFLASTPPTGAAVLRYLLNAPILTIKMTISLIQKDYLSNIDAMRDVFFSKETDDASLRRFQKLLNEYSTPMLVLDLKLLRAQLPLAPLAADKLPPALVLGSDADPLVDVTDVEVLGKHVHADTVKVISGSGHDVMLDWQWRQYASELVTFVKGVQAI